MAITDRQVREFFDTYEDGANTFEPDTIRSGAADVRLGLTPTEVSVLTWTDDYRERIASRHRWLTQRGYKAAKITSLEIVRISDLHTLANTTWEASYSRGENEEVVIAFHVSYLLRGEPGGLKVVVYISHEDENELLAEQGLLEPARRA